MPTATYTPLANITISGTATSITFSSISQSYRDLILVLDFQVSDSIDLRIRYNGDTSSSYNSNYAKGDGGSTSAASYANQAQFFLTGPGAINDSSNIIFNIFDYSVTDKQKTGLLRQSRYNDYAITWANRWANTSAITSISIEALGGPTFTAGMTAALYGVIA